MKKLHLITTTLVATLTLVGYATTGNSGQVSNSSSASKVTKTLSQQSTPQEIATALTGAWEGCVPDGNSSSYNVKINYTPSKDGQIPGNLYGTAYIYYNTSNCQGETSDRETINLALLSIKHHKNPNNDKYIIDLKAAINDAFPNPKHTKWVPFIINMGETNAVESLFLISTDGQYLASDEFVVKKAK